MLATPGGAAEGDTTGSPLTQSGPAIASQEFTDQFGAVDSLAHHRGNSVTVVVVTIRRLGMIERWERDLSARAPGMHFMNVADLPVDANVDLDRTAQTLRKRVPAGVAVLMDPGGAWAKAFHLDTTLPNLLLFDAEGKLKARFRGRWSPMLADEVMAAASGDHSG
ncbi:MAG: hypothetical protein R3F24_13010 [Gammaproteobacteria bacterium]